MCSFPCNLTFTVRVASYFLCFGMFSFELLGHVLQVIACKCNVLTRVNVISHFLQDLKRVGS